MKSKRLADILASRISNDGLVHLIDRNELIKHARQGTAIGMPSVDSGDGSVPINILNYNYEYYISAPFYFGNDYEIGLLADVEGAVKAHKVIGDAKYDESADDYEVEYKEINIDESDSETILSGGNAVLYGYCLANNNLFKDEIHNCRMSFTQVNGATKEYKDIIATISGASLFKYFIESGDINFFDYSCTFIKETNDSITRACKEAEVNYPGIKLMYNKVIKNYHDLLDRFKNNEPSDQEINNLVRILDYHSSHGLLDRIDEVLDLALKDPVLLSRINLSIFEKGHINYLFNNLLDRFKNNEPSDQDFKKFLEIYHSDSFTNLFTEYKEYPPSKKILSDLNDINQALLRARNNNIRDLLNKNLNSFDELGRLLWQVISGENNIEIPEKCFKDYNTLTPLVSKGMVNHEQVKDKISEAINNALKGDKTGFELIKTAVWRDFLDSNNKIKLINHACDGNEPAKRLVEYLIMDDLLSDHEINELKNNDKNGYFTELAENEGLI